MMKAYTNVKEEIEALFGVQGVILRICEMEIVSKQADKPMARASPKS